MPLNFPTNPTTNQTYTYNSVTWVWTGSRWEVQTSGSGSGGGVAQVYDVESTSTGFFDLPSGTTAQRPGGPTTGQLRYNSTTGFAEVYTVAGWGAFGAQPPAISSVTPSSYNGETNTEFTINGANFTVDASVKFVDNAGTEYIAAAVTYIDSTTLRARTPQDFTVAQEPLDVKVVQASGQVTRVDCIDCGGVPSWTTAAGSLGTQNMGTAVSIQLAATDPDAGATITYSVTSGTLPGGVTLNSSTGLLSGTAPSILGDTTYNFTVTAADNAGNQSARAFSFTVIAIDPNWAQVTMLLRGNGADGSTTIVDSSNTGRTFTIVGSTAISTSIKKFGTGSIAVLGGGNTASFYQSSGSITLPGAFTMEAWVYLLGSGRHALMGEPSGSAYSTGWGFAILDTIGPYGQTGAIKGISWILSPINGYGGNVVWSGQYPTLNTWTHIAVCRNSNGNWSFYMDGVKGTTQNSNAQSNTQYSGFPTDDGPTGSMTIPVYTGNFNGLTSGGNSVGMPAGFNGYIDEFRVTVGTARYSANFTPPSGPFPNQ